MKTKQNQGAELTATSLKNCLWETMQEVKNGSMQPAQGSSVARSAREIVRCVQTQLAISNKAKREVPTTLLTFSES